MTSLHKAHHSLHKNPESSSSTPNTADTPQPMTRLCPEKPILTQKPSISKVHWLCLLDGQSSTAQNTVTSMFSPMMEGCLGTAVTHIIPHSDRGHYQESLAWKKKKKTQIQISKYSFYWMFNAFILSWSQKILSYYSKPRAEQPLKLRNCRNPSRGLEARLSCKCAHCPVQQRDIWNLHGGKRELALTSCPLTSTCPPCHACRQQTYALNKQVNGWIKAN